MPLTLRLPFTNIINKYNANRSVYLKKKKQQDKYPTCTKQGGTGHFGSKTTTKKKQKKERKKRSSVIPYICICNALDLLSNGFIKHDFYGNLDVNSV